MESTYHTPVMAQESLTGLALQPDSSVVDATFGGGGHARLILEHLGPEGRLWAFDQDEDAQANPLLDDPRLTLFPVNFKYCKHYLQVAGVHQVDAILADLGVSSHQFDTPERGFSFRHDAPLDMRMSETMDAGADHLLNTYDEKQLIHLFSYYGEVTNARTLAHAIIAARSSQPILFTSQLTAIAGGVLPPKTPLKKYLAKVYQALRMVVNQELEALEAMLQGTLELLKPGGRLLVISYHSLEDRIVKQFLAQETAASTTSTEAAIYGGKDPLFKLIARKPLTPSEQELDANPRSRSAKLRIAERCKPLTQRK